MPTYPNSQTIFRVSSFCTFRFHCCTYGNVNRVDQLRIVAVARGSSLYVFGSIAAGRAGSRQLKDPVMGLTHNLGGIPNRNVCSVSILGRLNQ